MKKVGILTFHQVHNYGAVLQAWALSNTIGVLGHSATVIDYRPPDAHTVNSRRGLRAFVPSLGKLRMEQFVRRHIPLSDQTLVTQSDVNAHVAQQGYDALACGSDQVWFSLSDKAYDPIYFLDIPGPDTLRRFSYAPSAGPVRDFSALTQRIAPALARFDAVSVRDANTMAAVSPLDTPPVTRVVDPTMIADFTPLLRGASKRDFIAVVGKTDAAAERYIRFAAKTLGLPAIAFGTRCGAANKSRPFANPQEWLGALAGARLVITSLFHGAAISLALRTPFVALDCGGRAFKLEDLCDYCTIPERLLQRTDGQDDYVQDATLLNMDYASLQAHLTQTADASRQYLSEAING